MGAFPVGVGSFQHDLRIGRRSDSGLAQARRDQGDRLANGDDSGLVKMYAMVNVQKYQIVATGDSVSECEKNYMELMKQNGVNAETKESDSVKKATGTIAKITDAVVEGNTHQYILLENDSDIYDVSVVDYLDIVRYGVGDTITFEYMEGEQANTVLGIEK
jgi:hypothetical protein